MYRIFLFATLASAASDYGEYHFYKNTGGLFYDYSGNSFFAVNGQSVIADANDIAPTDRGAYFDGASSYITLHSQLWGASPVFGQDWGVSLWLYATSTGPILYRYNSASNFVMYEASLVSSDQTAITAYMCDGGVSPCSSISFTSSSRNYGLSKYYTDQWYLYMTRIFYYTSGWVIGVTIYNEPDELSSQTTYEYIEDPDSQYTTLLGTNLVQYFAGFVYFARSKIGYSERDTLGAYSTSSDEFCYFSGLGDPYCACSVNALMPSQLCVSSCSDPAVAGDCNVCGVTCSGICRADSTCIECLDTAWPTCDIDGVDYETSLCDVSCKGCTGPLSTECLNCEVTYASISGITSECECPALSSEISGECVCGTGYYMQLVGSVYECHACSSDCAECSGSANTCTSCNPTMNLVGTLCECPTNSALNASNECECDLGYALILSGSDYSCGVCDATCSTCLDDLVTCTSCTSPLELSGTACVCPFGFNLVGTSCECATGATLVGTSCECPTGEFIEDVLGDYVCSICSAECVECSGTATTCTQCPTTQNPVTGTCTCPDGSTLIDGSCVCGSGSFIEDVSGTYVCSACSAGCAECSGTATTCTQCPTGQNLVSGVCACPDGSTLIDGTCTCGSGSFIEDVSGTYVCSTCSTDCTECSGTATTCTQCAATKNLVSGTCVCPDGSTMLDGVCVCADGTFLDLVSDPYICGECDASCSTCENSSTTCTSCALENANVVDGVCFCPDNSAPTDTACECVDGYTSKFENTVMTCEQVDELVLVSYGSDPRHYLNLLLLFLLALLSLVQNKPASFWTLFNTVQIISYTPLYAIQISSQAFEVFQAIEISSYLPNITLLVMGMPQVQLDGLPENWRNYGFFTDNFFYNGGECILVFSVTILAALGLAILFGLKVSWALKKISVLRYNLFLRLLIEIYLEVIIPSSVSFDSVTRGNYWYVLFIGAGVHLVACLLPLFTFACLSKLHFLAVEDNVQRYQRASALFDEFAITEAPASILVYPIFFFRRMVFGNALFFLYDYPLLQVILNTATSILTLTLLIGFAKFNNKFEYWINVAVEVGVALITNVNLAFYFYTDDDEIRYLITNLTVCLVYTTMGIGMIPLVLPFLKKVLLFWVNPLKNSVNTKKSPLNETTPIQRFGSFTPVFATRQVRPLPMTVPDAHVTPL